MKIGTPDPRFEKLRQRINRENEENKKRMVKTNFLKEQGLVAKHIRLKDTVD